MGDSCNSLSGCEGCSILDQNKPSYAIMDHDELDTARVLFLSDSVRYKYGKFSAFSDLEINKVLAPATSFMDEDEYTFAASVKCPDVREADMSPNNMNLCRAYLTATIDRVQPELVLACGNLAMKMLVKKSGITSKRGKSFEYTSEQDHTCVVVPVFHPFSVLKEPRHKALFEMDIRNAYNLYIKKDSARPEFEYKLLLSFEELGAYNYLCTTEDTVARDIETTGLNFITDKIMTIALSCGSDNIVIPIDHKDSTLQGGERFAVLKWLSLVLGNPNNKKVFHNSKFDQKFLLNYGVGCVNVWDTKIMSHLVNENFPKSLMDLVKIYFPTELENL